MDPDQALKEFNDALYAAGLQKIMDEKQKQLDEWAASKQVNRECCRRKGSNTLFSLRIAGNGKEALG